jgi:hypothetical protein
MDRAERLVTAIFQTMTDILKPHLLELLRDELEDAKQEGISEAMEICRDDWPRRRETTRRKTP